jgi:hypothetical protein
MAVTQRLLGHKTVEMTAKHYTRLAVEDVRAAIEARAGMGAGRELRADGREHNYHAILLASLWTERRAALSLTMSPSNIPARRSG